MALEEEDDPQQQQLWYSHLRTDREWNDFRASAVALLRAMDCPAEQHDELIAQLIAAEEAQFWNEHGRDTKRQVQ